MCEINPKNKSFCLPSSLDRGFNPEIADGQGTPAGLVLARGGREGPQPPPAADHTAPAFEAAGYGNRDPGPLHTEQVRETGGGRTGEGKKEAGEKVGGGDGRKRR